MATNTAPNQDEMEDVQHKLLSMLQSVRLEEGAKPAPPPPKPTPAPTATSAKPAATVSPAPAAAPPIKKHTAPGCCSQCGEPEAFKTSSWCKACGFYPKLNRTVDVSDGTKEEKKIELDEVVDRVPMWVWSMAGGMILVFFVGVLIRLQIRSILDRGPLGLMFLLGGLVSVVMIHCRAFAIALKSSSSFKLASLVATPVEIWRVVFQQLPNTRRYFYTLAWGATAAFVGLVVIELDWNGLFKPSAKKEGGFNFTSWVMKMFGGMVGTVAQVQQATAPAGGGGPSMAADMLSAAGAMNLDTGDMPTDGNMEDALSGFAGQMTDGALEDIAGGATGGGGEGDGEGLMGHEALVEQARQLDEQQEMLEEQEAAKAAEEEAKAAAAAEEGKTGKQPADDEGTSNLPTGEGVPQSEGGKEMASANGQLGLPGTGPNATKLGGTGGSGSSSAANPDMKRGTYLILGYTLSVSGEMHSLVLAEVNAGRVRYIDNVPVTGLSEDQILKLQEDLDGVASAKPFLKVPFKARWTKPAFECVVEYKAKTSAGKLDKPVVKSYARHVAPAAAPAAAKK